MNEAGTDYGKLNDLLKIQQALEAQLDEYIERWKYLNELAERIANLKN